jgi:NAD(P)-dependent dehydrogenase (short-subunit alcohol dehydrogenase family)
MATNKLAIVTGAGRGMGRSMALGLAAEGWTVIGTAARAAEELQDLARQGIEVHRTDVSNPDACAALVADILSRHGHIDALVNNAARGMLFVSDTFMTEPTRFWQADPAIWRTVIDTNVNGPFYMARAIVPSMLAAATGRIVNISMNKETMKRPGFSPYGPSKAALDSETVIWSGDLADTGITVNSLSPGGATETGMIPPGIPETMRATFLSPDVMVAPLLWLLSDAAADITGRRIVARKWDPADPAAAFEEPIIIA